MIYIRKTKEGATTIGECRLAWQMKPNAGIQLTVLGNEDRWIIVTDYDCTVFILSDSGQEIFSLTQRGAPV